MINNLIKRQKFIAAFLFSVFYLNLVVTLSAGAASTKNYFDSTWRLTANQNLFSNDYSAVKQNKASLFGSSVVDNAHKSTEEKKYAPEKKFIGGPGQPEMNSFQSAGTSNMVDLFTGDFSYNLPLMDVGGYPVNIHYSSGISMDQEASWVGLGWNVNPGTISRSLRGIPDDFNGKDSITRTQNIKENKTIGVTLGGDLELIGLPILKLGARLGLFHNTYNGWGTEFGLNASVNSGQTAKGPLSGSLGITNNSQTGLDISPSLSLRIGKKDAELNGAAQIGSNYNSRAGISGLQLHTEVRHNYTSYFNKSNGENARSESMGIGMNSYLSFATPSYTPTITIPLTSKQFAFTGKVGGEVWGTYGNAFIEGYVSKQFIRPQDQVQKIPAYGYLHYSKAVGQKVLLDFNREKDIAFNHKTTPHIAIPRYSYDIYSITAEGTGGMFRPYRGDVGYIYDHAVKSNSESDRISGDLGFGSVFHGGIDFSNTVATTQTGAWKIDNEILKNIGFRTSDSTFEEVYFRNPGEKSINASSFYRNIGDDSLIRVQLSGAGANVKAASAFTKFNNAKPTGDIAVGGRLAKIQRDKRSQVISYLNAKEASLYGLEKDIKSYDTSRNPVIDCNQAFSIISRADNLVRKEHHISEIRVLNPDGRRYVYGLPVYNVEQKDLSFAVEKETETADLNKGLASYDAGTDNTTSNAKGKDSYFNQDLMPAYAHSFLLTGLLSPDYVDITGNGITEDDMGDGVKFNYTQVYGAHNGYYSWRTPFEKDKVNYNEGLKSYERDDKGTYLFGKKEVWYMHSIESKTMIALFKISDRNDAMSIMDENGGFDSDKKLKRLDSIELFVKADLVKNGSAARPIKTVHFEYTNELCKNITGSGSEGKLTLKKIWFSYNGNYKGKLNPHTFYYHPNSANNEPRTESNPSYNSKSYDRWGNYKDPLSNPGGLSNIDYPYAPKDGVKASLYASAWHLTDIKLPSGGRMRVTYEADDYAYVQNKRATEFFSIAGLGTSSSSTPQKFLYTSPTSDCHFVFVDVSSAVANKADIFTKYLEGIEKIYFKVAVEIPGGGYDFVPTYGEIEDYGTVAGNDKRIWIKLKSIDGQSPIAKAATQFLRLNLPSKAYPKSESMEGLDLGGAVEMLASGFDEIKNALQGFDKAARTRNWCKEMVDEISFIRLNNPLYKKYGGGVRVKKVEIADNWNKMTTKPGVTGLKESVYGQQYSYTTAKMVNGNKITISSGVATYEPMIGGEENPFRVPIEYTEKVAPLAPTNYVYTETPLAESFFPSPMIGYSKVRVRTINAKAKSANGWEETEFFTTKDFPTIVEFTPLDGDSKKRYNPGLRNFLRIHAKHYLTVSQGFKIELNDMNGKLKSQASYPENDSLNPVYYTANFYKVDDDKAFQKRLNNTVWATDSANGHINTQAEIGKEVEIMVDVRQQLSVTFSGSVSANLDAIPGFALPIIPIPSKFNLPQLEENRFRSIAVMKVVQRYGILDSVVVIDKGSLVSTKNLVYDGETGNAIVSRTNNEFNDPIYNFNYPAHWAYSGMGMAYKNTDLRLYGRRIVDGKMVLSSGFPDPAEGLFESGDEIMVTGYEKTGQSEPPYGSDCPGHAFGENSTSRMIWAIDAQKGKQNHQGIYFIDKDGKPYSGISVLMRVLRSGKRNFTDASVGAITALANPVKEISPGSFRIVIDSTSRVINTTASVFKDFWQINNTIYEKDTSVKVTKHFTISIAPIAVDRRVLYSRTKHADIDDAYFPNVSSTVASFNYIRGGGGCRSRAIRSKSMLRFNFAAIPANATVSNAIIGLAPSIQPENIYRVERNDCGRTFLSFDWTSATGHYIGDARVNLKRIMSDWNSETKYASFNTTDNNQVLLNFNDYSSKNCTSLISDAVRLQSPGLMFEIFKNAPSDGEQSEINYLSFRNFSVAEASSPALTITYSVPVDSVFTVCRNSINDTAMNPYRWGILGNWRMDRSYTFYHERKESEALSAETNIRKEGELKSFVPYWQFSAANSVIPVEDTTRWVWNSAISQYNRKGFEIENYDPLGRYNSGIYGYSQSVPIAVAQNSKRREILFDGFEDYSYESTCVLKCQTPRDIDFLRDNVNASIVDVKSHSGRYSLKINSGTEATLTVPIDSLAADTIKSSLHAKVDSTIAYNTIVTGKGTGLSATYNCVYFNGTPLTRTEGPLYFVYDTLNLPACSTSSLLHRFGTEWKGKIQPKHTDDYIFHVVSTQTGAGIRLNNQQILSVDAYGGNRSSSKIRLEAGKLYDIVISYPLFEKAGGSIELSWSSTQYQSKQIIPKANLYPFNLVTADTMGSVRRDLLDYCIKFNNVKPEQIVKPLFSPLQGSKLVINSWINTGEANCDTTSPIINEEGQLIASFDVGGEATTVSLQKTGVPIEGWQRYEGVVNVPETATQMILTLKSAASQSAYFDDIRIHPYNGNMKSFVYDPVNLRLMAELDENNYAGFYEYDDDGTLIRVKKETERGIKTIKESRSALYKEE